MIQQFSNSTGILLPGPPAPPPPTLPKKGKYLVMCNSTDNPINFTIYSTAAIVLMNQQQALNIPPEGGDVIIAVPPKSSQSFLVTNDPPNDDSPDFNVVSEHDWTVIDIM